MSARLGLRKRSPGGGTACTTSATMVARDSASWRWRRSGRPLTSLPPKSRPTQTATLESSSAAVPAARLVIQKRCSVTAATGIGRSLGLAGRDGGRAGVGRAAARARGVVGRAGGGAVVRGARVGRGVVGRRGRLVRRRGRVVRSRGRRRGGPGPARCRRRRAHRAVVGD